MSVNAPLGATPESGAFDVTAAATLVGPARTLRKPRSRPREERIAIGSTLAIPALGLLLCIAGTRSAALAPQTLRLVPQISGMAGPLKYIGFRLSVGEVIAALVMLVLLYLTALRYHEHIPARLLIWAVAAFTVIVMIGPPLFSTDAFSYQGYAQMLVHYHANPYVYGFDVTGNPYPLPNTLAGYIGSNWTPMPSVYGPLFTFFSAAFASVSIGFSYFAFKMIAAAASGATLWLIWKAAQRRGVSPVRGIALFGLNPMVTLFGIGGGHNDLLMLALTTAGVYAVLCRRERAAGTLLTAGTAIKLTGAIVLPFALLGDAGQPQIGSRRRRLTAAIVASSLVVAAASYVAFGTGILNMAHTLQRVQDLGTWQSLPGFVFSLTKLPITQPVRIADDVLLAAAVLWLLRRVWQGRMDWIDGAAWATFAVLLTAWSLVPWYFAWLMPLVALSSNRRLWNAATVATLVGGILMIASCFPWWNGL